MIRWPSLRSDSFILSRKSGRSFMACTISTEARYLLSDGAAGYLLLEGLHLSSRFPLIWPSWCPKAHIY